MPLSYATFITRVLQFLQDTGAATYTSTKTNYAVENELKILSRYSPVLIDAIFQVESREGYDTAGTASKLTDTTKSQFLAADATNEKVVHNITDDTWAVVTGYTSSSILSISKGIMASGEEYEIYNKRCKSKRQIYIGAMLPFLGIDSCEYPLGTERNYLQIARDIIEIQVENNTIEDSNSTLTTLNSVDVLIRFALSQVLCQLTDLAGAVHTAGAAAATTLQVKDFTDAQIIEVGEMFNIATHRTTYIVITEVTLANQATTGSTLAFYPGLEAVTTAGDVITFVKSSLPPLEENLLERMVCSELVQSEQITKVRSGAPVLTNYQKWLNNNPLLNPLIIQQELQSLVIPKMRKRLPRT